MNGAEESDTSGSIPSLDVRIISEASGGEADRVMTTKGGGRFRVNVVLTVPSASLATGMDSATGLVDCLGF